MGVMKSGRSGRVSGLQKTLGQSLAAGVSRRREVELGGWEEVLGCWK